MRRRIPRFIAILIILGASFGIHAAGAQSTARIDLIAIESSDFPTLSMRFEAFDEQNQFIRDLQASQVRVFEGEQPRPLSDLELLQPGAHFIAAINLGPELSNRYAGVSRYESIQAALLAWAQSQPAATSDLFSLAANTGLQLIRSGDPAEWAAAVSGYQPDLLSERPSLNALTRAVDLATDANPESQRKNAILFITPLFFNWNQEAADNLAGRAAAQEVRINVWLVASESSAANNPQITQGLEALAAETGGQFSILDVQSDLPDPDQYLDPLRYTYLATYDSAINTSGSHELRLEMDYSGNAVISQPKPLFITIEPPNPIFLSPPSFIERKWVKGEGQKDARLVPDTADLRIVIEFPDGHERPLQSSRLYVDGELAAENTAPPFDTFQWDLSAIVSDGRHILRVEVADTLGLNKSSIEWPVDLIVEPQKVSPFRAIITRERLLTLGAILAAGAVLVIALILSGRQTRERRRISRKALADPLTQPVPARIEPPSKPRLGSVRSSSERTTVPRRAAAELAEAKAWLVRVSENGLAPRGEIAPPQPATAIPLVRRETTIGSDPRRALYRLDAATVSGLHARILMTSEGDYRIFDSGSIAGTWVNYAPVPSQGLKLKHGDLIQIGKEAFRFQLAEPPEEPKPTVETFGDTP